jgi:hypothetical protein
MAGFFKKALGVFLEFEDDQPQVSPATSNQHLPDQRMPIAARSAEA